MQSGKNSTDNKFYYQFLVMQDSVYYNKKYTDDINMILKKHDYGFTKIRSYFTKIQKILKHIMVQNHNLSPDNMDSLKAQDPATLVLAYKKAPLL